MANTTKAPKTSKKSATQRDRAIDQFGRKVTGRKPFKTQGDRIKDSLIATREGRKGLSKQARIGDRNAVARGKSVTDPIDKPRNPSAQKGKIASGTRKAKSSADRIKRLNKSK